MLTLPKREPLPPRILIYGGAGLGKSTFGAGALDPVFIQTESGLDNLDVPAFPLAESYQTVLEQIGQLAEDKHSFKTVVVDSVDWLETLIWKQVAAEAGVKGVEAIPYGKGYSAALDLWGEYLQGLEYLRKERGMTIIQIGHSEIKRYENPETDGYDRHGIKMHKSAAAKIMEYSDIVLFVNYFVATTKKKDGFSEKVKAIGSGERVLYTQERPAFFAKTRYDLPAEIPFDKGGEYWGVLAPAIPFYAQMEETQSPTQTEKDETND